MKRNTIDFLFLLLLIFVFISSYFFISKAFVPLEAEYEVNHILKEHDPCTIKQIAANQKTADFLIKLKTSDRCTDVSDDQGHTNDWTYYAAAINNHVVGIYMKQQSVFYWKIKKINYYQQDSLTK